MAMEMPLAYRIVNGPRTIMLPLAANAAGDLSEFLKGWAESQPRLLPAVPKSPTPLRFNTINIEPMRSVLRREGRSEESGLRRALHICRGHFATYTEDKPRFGRPGEHGSFWIPQHVRGSVERGVVVSDYNVKPKTEERT